MGLDLGLARDSSRMLSFLRPTWWVRARQERAPGTSAEDSVCAADVQLAFVVPAVYVVMYSCDIAVALLAAVSSMGVKRISRVTFFLGGFISVV